MAASNEELEVMARFLASPAGASLVEEPPAPPQGQQQQQQRPQSQGKHGKQRKGGNWFGSVPASTPKPQAPVVTYSRSGWRIVGFLALLFAIPAWLEGARFTRDGWIAFIDGLLGRLGIPYQIPSLPWWVGLVLMVVLGKIYGHIEMDRWPIRRPQGWSNFFNFALWHVERWEVWVVFLIVILSDVGTTYIGARNNDPNDIQFLVQLAQNGTQLAIYAILVTFVPDRLARWGWRKLRDR
jgi:hypothetical protein